MSTFPRLPRESERASWFVFGLWSVVIYLTVPLANAIRSGVARQWGRPAFAVLVIGCVLASLITATLHLRREGRGWTPSRIGWLAAVAAGYIGWTLVLAASAPEEAVHFLEYGVLGLLAFRALTHRMRDRGIYFLATILCGLVGTGDEILQFLTPGRYFAFSDIVLNAGAGALMQVALAGGLRPSYIAGWPGPESRRRLAGLGAAQLILLGICASNTPARTAWYAPRVPFLRYLTTNEGVMTEYGYRFHDPETGTWYSRFSLAELVRLDAKRHREAARVLDEYRDEKRYPEFLKRFTPVTDPFVHEARVHVFRRDRFIQRIADFPNDVGEQRFHATVAFRENRILEKHFPLTLAAYSGKLTPDRRAYLEAMLDPEMAYVTRVGQDLIVRFTEGQIWAGVLCGAAILIGWGRRRPPRMDPAGAAALGDAGGAVPPGEAGGRNAAGERGAGRKRPT